MKKLTKIVSPIFSIALACIMLFACSKPAPTSSVAEIGKLSDQYTSSIIDDGTTSDKEKKDKKKAMKVAGEDLTKALKGATAGAALGTVIPGLGTGAGAVIGAVVAGAGASLSAAGSSTYRPPAGGGNGTSHTIDFSGFVANPTNAYDEIGLMHYTEINEFLQTAHANSSLSDFYLQSIVNMEGVTGNPNVSAYTLQMYEDDLQLPSYADGPSFADAVEQMYLSGEISMDVRNILIPYLQTFDAITGDDPIGFATYSVNVENIVSNDPSIVELDKRFILGTMATARYGIQYWSHFTL